MNIYSKVLLLLKTVMLTIVVIPASIVGIVLLFLVIVGDAPIRMGVAGLFIYAEEAVRPASPGTVLVVNCVSKTTINDKPAPVICDASGQKEISVSQAIEGILYVLHRFYMALLVISGVGMVVFYFGKKESRLNYFVAQSGSKAIDDEVLGKTRFE